MRQNALPAFIQYVRDNFCDNKSVLSFKIGVAGGDDACTAGKGRATTGSFFPYQPSHNGELVFKPDGYMYQFDILTVLTAQITNVHVLGDLEGALISAFSSSGEYSTKKCANDRPGGDTVTRPGFIYVVARYKPGKAPAVTQAGAESPAEPLAERPVKKAKLDKKTPDSVPAPEAPPGAEAPPKTTPAKDAALKEPPRYKAPAWQECYWVANPGAVKPSGVGLGKGGALKANKEYFGTQPHQ